MDPYVSFLAICNWTAALFSGRSRAWKLPGRMTDYREKIAIMVASIDLQEYEHPHHHDRECLLDTVYKERRIVLHAILSSKMKLCFRGAY